MKVVFITFIVLFGVLAEDTDPDYGDSWYATGMRVNIWKSKKLSDAMPKIVFKLFEWPDKQTLKSEKRVDPTLRDVLVVNNSSVEWIKEVLDKSWLSPPKTEMIFLKKEFDILENDSKGKPIHFQVDTSRIQWDQNGFHIEVSQTHTIFAIKLIPIDKSDTGRDKKGRYEYAKNLCMKIFNKEAKRPGETIPDFKSKIISYSFDPAKMRELPLDKAVVGNPRTMKDDGIDDSATLRSGEFSIEQKLKTSEAWGYWFRQIHWWNDGKAVGFYFLEITGPAGWIPSFTASVNENWIGPDRDRSGKVIPEKK